MIKVLMSIFYKIVAPVFLAILIMGCKKEKSNYKTGRATIYAVLPEGKGFAEGYRLKITGGKFAYAGSSFFDKEKTDKYGQLDIHHLTPGNNYCIEVDMYRPIYTGYTYFTASTGDQDVILQLYKRPLEEIEILTKRVEKLENANIDSDL